MKNQNQESNQMFLELFGEDYFEKKEDEEKKLKDRVKNIKDLEELKQLLEDEYHQKGNLSDILSVANEKDNPLIIKALIQIGLIEQLNNKNKLYLDSIEILSNDEIKEIVSKGYKIRLKKLNGLTQEKIELLEDGVEITGNMIGKYSKEEISEIVAVMKILKENIPEGASEIYKFLYGYDSIGRFADYDRRGCKDNEQSTEEAVNLTRSLKGVFLQGRVVCVGYALAMEKFLNYIGVETLSIGGMAYTEHGSGEHEWNISKVEGAWYKSDLTWDARRLKGEKEPEYCLRSDDVFDKKHKVDEKREDIKCPKDYPQEKISSILSQIRMNRKKAKSQSNIGMEIWEKIAAQENSYVYTQTLIDLKDIIDRNIEPEKVLENEGENR